MLASNWSWFENSEARPDNRLAGDLRDNGVVSGTVSRGILHREYDGVRQTGRRVLELQLEQVGRATVGVWIPYGGQRCGALPTVRPPKDDWCQVTRWVIEDVDAEFKVGIVQRGRWRKVWVPDIGDVRDLGSSSRRAGIVIISGTVGRAGAVGVITVEQAVLIVVSAVGALSRIVTFVVGRGVVVIAGRGVVVIAGDRVVVIAGDRVVIIAGDRVVIIAGDRVVIIVGSGVIISSPRVASLEAGATGSHEPEG